MTDTDTYRRWRVDGVEETPRGLLAFHGERLRIDVVREDVVRVKISRGGSSTTADLCRVRRPARGRVGFTVEREDDVVR